MKLTKKIFILSSLFLIVACNQVSKEELPKGETLNEVSETIATFTYSSREVEFLVNTSNVFIAPNKSFQGYFFITSPTLPDGLTIDTVTGVIAGTPSTTFPTTDFLIEARGSSESQFANVKIGIGEEPPLSLKYEYSTLSFTKQAAGSYSVVESEGGEVDNYSISPALPSGLTLDSSGTISGSPDSASLGLFTITASNTTGQTSTTLTISISDTAPQLTGYSNNSQNLNILNPFSTMVPTITDTASEPKPDQIAYSVFPRLPNGLSLNSDGTISGTPLETIGVSSFKITAYNDIGSSSFDITINLTDIPRQLTYPQASYDIQQGIALTNINVNSYEGITPVVFSLDGTEPTGISINSITGLISGTTSAAVGVYSVIVRATHIATGNITSTLVTFNLSEDIPESSTNMGYLNAYQLYEDQAFSITPSIAGGSPSSYTINPDISTTIPGLSFNTTSGTISGTPTAAITATSFNITGFNIDANSGTIQTANQSVFITVSTLAPLMLGYVPSSSSFYNSTTNIFELDYNSGATLDIRPNISAGGIPTLYSISPNLADGLNFNSITGEITGTPTEIIPVQYFTITGTNTAGSFSETIALSISDPAFSASSLSSYIRLRGKPYEVEILDKSFQFIHEDITLRDIKEPFQLFHFDMNQDGSKDIVLRNKICDLSECPAFTGSTSIYLQDENALGLFSKTLKILPPLTYLNAIALTPLVYGEKKAGIAYINTFNSALQTRSTTHVEFSSTPLKTRGVTKLISNFQTKMNTKFAVVVKAKDTVKIDEYKLMNKSMNNVIFERSSEVKELKNKKILEIISTDFNNDQREEILIKYAAASWDKNYLCILKNDGENFNSKCDAIFELPERIKLSQVKFSVDQLLFDNDEHESHNDNISTNVISFKNKDQILTFDCQKKSEQVSSLHKVVSCTISDQ